MSVFCTPDGRPFYAGTYFPPEERHGMPAFRRVVRALGEAWVNERAQVLEQADALVGAVRTGTAPGRDAARGAGGEAAASLLGGGAPALDADALVAQVVAGLECRIRPGVGRLRAGARSSRARPWSSCACGAPATAAPTPSTPGTWRLRTLDAMAAGGIYDHLVGGFCRYSTDARWLVPHFEKMLTDQALLGRAYLHAWQATGHGDYLRVVTETMDWVLRDLSDAGGRALLLLRRRRRRGRRGAMPPSPPTSCGNCLPAALVGPAAEWYGITEAGNWEGRSIPVRPVGAPLERPAEVEEARSILAAARARRVQPARDEKVLTEWNAMAAATLAEVAAATGIADYGERAEEICEFLCRPCTPTAALMRSWQGGRARHLAVASGPCMADRGLPAPVGVDGQGRVAGSGAAAWPPAAGPVLGR